jgi:hypothetical protein
MKPNHYSFEAISTGVKKGTIRLRFEPVAVAIAWFFKTHRLEALWNRFLWFMVTASIVSFFFTTATISMLGLGGSGCLLAGNAVATRKRALLEFTVYLIGDESAFSLYYQQGSFSIEFTETRERYHHPQNWRELQ